MQFNTATAPDEDCSTKKYKTLYNNNLNTGTPNYLELTYKAKHKMEQVQNKRGTLL